MARVAATLPKRPEARTYTVAELVAWVLEGRVRIPDFQSELRWTRDDVRDLFDSILRGFPIGSLLLNQAPATAGRLPLGPLRINAGERRDALWVVDGQQRLVSLASALGRSTPIPERATDTDPFVVYFDVRKQSFESSGSPTRQADQVPAPFLLDAAVLSEFVHGWELRSDEVLRRTLFQAAAAIRDYEIPAYILEAADDEVLRSVFHRTNKGGKPLSWTQVHDALFGGSGRSPNTLTELADAVETVGMGRPDDGVLLRCVQASRGLDVTKTIEDQHRRDPSALAGAVAEALPATRSALAFLRDDAEIPHLRLLPRSGPLVILTRFFQTHAEPGPRVRILLRRFVWRSIVAEWAPKALNERTLMRRAVAGIDDDAEASVQRLLELVKDAPTTPFDVPEVFDARAAGTRLGLLALGSLKPRSLATGGVIDLGELVSEHGAESYARIVDPGTTGRRGLENLLLAPPGTNPWDELTANVGNREVLASHAVSPNAEDALRAGQSEAFLAERRDTIATFARDLIDRMTERTRGDRPSLDYLLRDEVAEDDS